MVKVSLAEYIQDILDDDEPVYFADAEQERDGDTCPGCDGKGRYVGFRWIEDPCEVCGGSGWVNPEGLRDALE